MPNLELHQAYLLDETPKALKILLWVKGRRDVTGQLIEQQEEVYIPKSQASVEDGTVSASAWIIEKKEEELATKLRLSSCEIKVINT